jgi:anti-anti-sigma factor
MSTPLFQHPLVETNSYFALTVRLSEPDQRMTVEIEGDLDIATIPFLEGILIAAEHVDPEEVVIDVSRLAFVGVVGVRALTEEAERLEMRGRRTRLIGASATVKRLVSLTGGFDWLDGRPRLDSGAELADDEATRVPRLVARTIHSIVPGARCVSITSSAGRRFETLASTHPLAEQLDRIQYRQRSGPCVEAARDRVQTVSHDLQQEPRWPDFAAAAAHRRIRSVLSTPIPVRPGQVSGPDGPSEAIAVNIYSEHPSQFDEERRRLVASLAAHATQLASSASAAGAES